MRTVPFLEKRIHITSEFLFLSLQARLRSCALEVADLSECQDVSKIVNTLNQCLRLLPREHLRHVVEIAVCGQMHGVVLWKR